MKTKTFKPVAIESYNKYLWVSSTSFDRIKLQFKNVYFSFACFCLSLALIIVSQLVASKRSSLYHVYARVRMQNRALLSSYYIT